MKGTNELHLNTATMIEATQQWLDAKMPHGAPTVTSVREINGSFCVVVSDTTDRTEPRAA